jgi:predicted CxxxxCH...CXXCH cytochrome family protein
MCHRKPASFADPNHIDTNNGAEMRFAALAGSGATYSPSATQCDSVYCHGNGRTPSGTVDWTTDVQLGCGACHGYTSNPRALSGEHNLHIRGERTDCSACHAGVVNASGTIIRRALHTNGVKNVSFSGGGVYNAATRSCSSINCHGTERW